MYLQHWHGWCHMKLLLSRCILCTPYNHAQCHFMKSHICKVHACLAVTCHLHVWQNDWDLLHAAAVTQVCNRYWNKSQHRKLTLKKKILQGLEPMTFQSWVWHCNHWAVLIPYSTGTIKNTKKYCGIFWSRILLMVDTPLLVLRPLFVKPLLHVSV